ncbi:MAG: penicillin binding protein PBP4B [Thermotaleaceae bacterium]
MYRNHKLKLSILLLLMLIVSATLIGYAVDNHMAVLGNKGEVLLDEPTGASQIEPRFPEKDPTSRVYAQSRRVFKGYEGKGEILIENHGVQSASLYMNGKKLSINKVFEQKEGKTSIDISRYTVTGENTLKVLDVQPENTYLSISIPYPQLTVGRGKEVGFSEKKLGEIDELINKEIRAGFPGAVLLIMKDGKIIKNTAYGYKLKYDGDMLLNDPEPMDTNTLFDLASNTKMFATNIAIQKLVSENKINIQDPVCKYIPGFTGETRENIRIKDLLTHSAGFAASIKFYMPDNPYGEEFYSLNRERTLRLLEKAPLEYPTGTKTIYSDTDYMLLGYIIENVTGMKLDEYVETNIYKPLGLTHTLFNPLDKGFEKSDCGATETMGNTRGGSLDYPSIRRYTLQGEVHDEKAYYTMEGIAGHAGLFSTASDLAVLCQALLNQGGYGNIKIFDQDVFDQFTKPSDNDITFGLGWNRAGNGDKVWQFGPYASNTAIGHTGWTGTLVQIDPKYDMAIVLLTNKKHSPCKNENFEGDQFETGKYGSIVSLVYEALLENR